MQNLLVDRVHLVTTEKKRVIHSEAEKSRASPCVTSTVGQFHDRHWLPRNAVGDEAAASSACVAALSSDPTQRSVAAHLYAVRAAQRLVSQVVHTVRHHVRSEDDDQPITVGGVEVDGRKSAADWMRTEMGEEFVAELETAVGASMHSELCRMFDEMSGTYNLMLKRSQDVVARQQQLHHPSSHGGEHHQQQRQPQLPPATPPSAAAPLKYSRHTVPPPSASSPVIAARRLASTHMLDTPPPASAPRDLAPAAASSSSSSAAAATEAHLVPPGGASSPSGRMRSPFRSSADAQKLEYTEQQLVAATQQVGSLQQQVRVLEAQLAQVMKEAAAQARASSSKASPR